LLRERRLVALVCVAVLVAVAMAPLAPVAFCAILVPLGPLFGAVQSGPFATAEKPDRPASPEFTPLPARAPPGA
jgi:hypothetical protein